MGIKESAQENNQGDRQHACIENIKLNKYT